MPVGGMRSKIALTLGPFQPRCRPRWTRAINCDGGDIRQLRKEHGRLIGCGVGDARCSRSGAWERADE